MIFFKRYKRKTDAELITLTSQRDNSAFEEIIERHEKAVYGFALRLLKSSHEAEDISQEVFLRLYRAVGSYNSTATLRTYLFRITKNLCIDYYRKKRPELMDELPEMIYAKSPFKQLYSSELRLKIEETANCLSQKKRAVLYLRHEQGLSYKEIAKVMGLTVSNVDSLLTRARREFKEQFGSIKEMEFVE